MGRKRNKRKNRKRNKRGLTLKGKILTYIFLLVLIILLILTLFLTLPQFKLKEIKVSNLVKIKEEEILKRADFVLEKNIFRQNYRKAKKDILDIKSVKQVNISMAFPNGINIDIEERKETYQIKSDKSYYILDEQGYFLKKVDKKINIPEIIGIEPQFEDEKRFKKEELKVLEDVNKIFNTAKTLSIDGLIDSITMKKKGFEIYFASSKKRAHFDNTNNLINSMQFVREILYSQEERNKSGDIYTTEEGVRFRPK